MSPARLFSFAQAVFHCHAAYSSHTIAMCTFPLIYKEVSLVTNLHQAPRKYAIFPFSCLSVYFNSHFPGGPGLDGTRMFPFWILLELRMMDMVMTVGAVRL